MYMLVVLLLLAGYTYWALNRPLPTLSPTSGSLSLQTPTAASKLAWPATGQSAVGIAGSTILETHGVQKAVPIASTAKLVTALVVLRQKPLDLSQQGPVITLSAADVALYAQYAAKGGSVVPVQAGEQVSEYQMLQAMLLPSANNIADSLAIWAYGSLGAYATAANAYLSGLGLDSTHVGADASGFEPGTTGTAHDLTRLGELAMQNPVLSQIVGQTTAGGIPLTNTVKNVNSLLGTANIVGVKTGNTDEAGGVYVSASRVTVNSQPVTIVTALVGAPTLFEAMKDSLPLIQSAQANFKSVPIIKAGAVVGHYQLPWGGNVSAIASQNLSLAAWNGNTVPSIIQLQTILATAQAGQTVGTLTVSKSILAGQESVPIKLQATPAKPTIWWHLYHLF